jgi:hypothetical protein
MLASSSQACLGHENAVWTVQVRSSKVHWHTADVNSSNFSCFQVEEGHQIQFNLDYFMLPCATQSIRIRDGRDAWMSELIGEYTGRGIQYSGPVISSGNLVLIDFHLNDSQIVSNACYAGFIGHVELIGESLIDL